MAFYYTTMAIRASIWSNLALAIAAPVIFFSLCEGLLYLAGVQPLSLTEDPYVGFASSQPLFVEKLAEDGGKTMATNPAKMAHFNLQTFSVKKDPGTFRIFSLGGSTAYGHPWRDPVSFSGWLRELLPAADPAKKWEVINAGGISYASYREATLMAELIRYQPDLFLIYSGHNEFLEERTYRKTAEIPVAVRELSSILDQTRTYSALRRLARKPGSGASDRSSESAAPAAGSGGGTFNMAAEVDDVLARTIGPTSYVRDDTLRRDVLDHYRISLTRMAKLAHSVGAQIIFLTTPGNEKDCSPFKSQPRPGLSAEESLRISRWLDQAHSLSERPAEASVFYDSAVEMDDRNAAVLYRAGLAAYAAGDQAKAKRLFRKSLDEDICPLRAPTAMHSIVLETARETGSQAIDVTALLEEKTRKENGHSILGEPQFVDHVHLSIDDYRFLALAIVEKMDSLGLARIGEHWNNAAFEENPEVNRIAAEVMAKMGPREMGEGLHNLAKVVNWAGKHEDAARIAERALATDSSGLEAIWSSLFVGAALERQGKTVESLPHYRRAVRLDPANPLSHRYLGSALMRQGLDAEAAAAFATVAGMDPGDAENRADLGMLLMRLKRAPEAIPHLAAALTRFPDRADLRTLHGQALLAAGRAPEAEGRFQEALRRNPGDAHAMLGLARIAEARGNLPEAINLYAKAMSLDPNLTEARAALSRALGGMPIAAP